MDRTRPTNSTTAPFRSVPAPVAVELALREADRLGASLRTERLGSSGPGSIVSRLVRNGTGLASGFGSGSGDQALASAHFEALERYLMSAQDNRRLAPGAARLVTAQEVAGQAALGADLVIQRWAAEFPAAVAACSAYDGDSGTVWYPLFLSDPRYFRNPLPGDSTQPYRSLLRYSSSLGTAAGADRDEAALHGLCELIEHDAVSHAMLRWFIAGDPTAYVVEPVPEHLRDLHDEARAAAGAAVHLFDVTTDLGIPAYLAVADQDGPQPAHAGAGASPLAGHAARRALNELILTALARSAGPAGPTDLEQRLAPWPPLLDCVFLPVGRLDARPRRWSAASSAATDPRGALDHLTRHLHGHGIDVFACEVSPPGSLINVTTTIAPGLERFSLVHLGMPVLPTGRGWPIWATRR